MHTADITRDEIHRSGTEECDHGDYIIQGLRFHLHQVAAHTSPFNLEDAGCLAAPEKFKSLGIIDRDIVQA